MKKQLGKIHLTALALIVGGLLLFLLSGKASEPVSDTEIYRNDPGGGAKNIELSAEIEDVLIEEIGITVDEREYTKEECDKLFKVCKEDLVREFLAENTDLSNITGDLNYVSELKGYPFSFEYETDSPNKIDATGQIICEEPFSAMVRITASHESYRNSYILKLSINPDMSIKERVYKGKILSTLNDSGQKDSKVVLPSEIEGKTVNYSTAIVKKEPAFILLGIVSAAAVVLGAARDEKDKRKKYKKVILKEYPAALRKISLYISSGMNLRNIWQAVYDEGVKKKGAGHPFYKEMGTALNELSSGISESQAYIRFGERIGEPEIIRFTALLSQNLKKGSSRLKELLREEVSKAFMEKKQRAIKAGEEAGTKMLFPMMLLLIDVMIIIVIPAFRGL